jgi:crossover junction endodeoxyribonuclease RuvC
MIILGIDPGTRVSGYGIIEVRGSSFFPIDYGCIRPPAGDSLFDRCYALFVGVERLIEKFGPAAVVVETQYVNKNVQSALKVGMARGSVNIAARKNGLDIFEYPPSTAKKAVVGSGSASKQQVQGMVQRLLSLSQPPPEDAADALSLAICHALRCKNYVPVH